MNRVIITGATSMIGNALVEACIEHQVRKIFAVVRPNSINISRVPRERSVQIIECDASEYSRLPDMIRDKCDIFYHFAWDGTDVNRNRDIPGQSQNITYTLQALIAAKALGCSRFIGAGSQAEFGKLNVDKIAPNHPANPVQPYGIAKYAAGKLAHELAKQLGLDLFWVRIFSVYGKYDVQTAMIPSTIRKMLCGERAPFTPAEQRWDYLYSADAGEAFYHIGEEADRGKTYCLGSGTARPLCEYIRVMRRIVRSDAEVGFGDIPYNKGTVMNLCADISELTADTGWRPRVSFEEGIRLTRDYLIDQYEREPMLKSESFDNK